MNRRDFLRSASTVSAGLILSPKETSSRSADTSANLLGTDPEMLDGLRREIVSYYRDQANAATGLIADRTQPGSPSSIAAVGMGLSVFIVAVERGLMPRTEAIDRTLKILRFFHNSAQGPEPEATGYKGFYYHFLDMQTGKRVWPCELSTVD